jgi:DNA-binding NarL/FixJ family response regulator
MIKHAWLRERKTGGSAPVMAMSAFITHADLARLLNASLPGFLPKPFGSDKLMEAILTVLNGVILKCRSILVP